MALVIDDDVCGEMLVLICSLLFCLYILGHSCVVVMVSELRYVVCGYVTL